MLGAEAAELAPAGGLPLLLGQRRGAGLPRRGLGAEGGWDQGVITCVTYVTIIMTDLL